jgi:hypothetical protein
MKKDKRLTKKHLEVMADMGFSQKPVFYSKSSPYRKEVLDLVDYNYAFDEGEGHDLTYKGRNYFNWTLQEGADIENNNSN